MRHAISGIWSNLVGLLLAGTSLAPSVARAEGPRDHFGMPKGALQRGGSLVIAGGGVLPEEVYEKFIELAGGRDARLVLIPWAHDFHALADARKAYAGWSNYNVRSLDYFNVSKREMADKDRYLRPLKLATGVWICGGDQGRLADLYGGTLVEEAIRDVVARGGVVGGTSAGASIMSEMMIRNGSSSAANLDRGFALARNLVIDQHFYERGRVERLFGVLSEHPRFVGLGIDEGSAVVLRQNRFHVLGQGKVSVCLIDNDPRDEGLEWICRLKDGDRAELVASDEDDDDGKPTFIEVQRVPKDRE